MQKRLIILAGIVLSLLLAVALQVSSVSPTAKAKKESECEACLKAAEQQFEQCMQAANAQNRGGSKREARRAAHEECRSAYSAAKEDCRANSTDCEDSDADDDDDAPPAR